MSMINEASNNVNDVTSIKQIDQTTMQEFLNKIAIWDFFEMSRDEFTSKSDYDREQLIIRYYNSLQSGIFCYLFFFVWVCFINDKCVTSKIISYSFISVWYIIVCSWYFPCLIVSIFKYFSYICQWFDFKLCSCWTCYCIRSIFWLFPKRK